MSGSPPPPIGIIPAAGRGTRLGRLPFCKELYPMGYRPAPDQPSGWQPFVVIEDLIERMVLAGARRIFIVLARGKSAVMDYLGDGSRLGIELCYLIQEEPRGMPYALALPLSWMKGETALFGMPDTIVRPKDVFVRLLAEHARTEADLTLGLFPTEHPERFGMVGTDAEGRVRENVDKPSATRLRHMWGLGCWGPRFADFMARHLAALPRGEREVVLSSVFQGAVDAGQEVRSLAFEEGTYIDVGTVDGLRHGLQHFTED